MPSRPREISSLGIYHVVYRGVNKQQIFEDEDDYGKFLTVLRKYQPICGYKIIAYCLMSNHIHLLIKPGKIPLAGIFQRVIPSFVYWYNKRYERVGSLFQSRFRSSTVKYSSYKNYFDDDLIDSSFVRSEVSVEFFRSFNCAENDDQCLDIDDERPRMKDERAVNIMQRLSGCSNVTEFQHLDTKVRNEVLYDMWMAGISMSQASRVTGVSYGVIRKVIAAAERK